MTNSRSKQQDIHNLEELLQQLQNKARNRQQVSVSTMLEAVGTRSFGPLLMFAGLIPASPLSGVPGVPTLSAVLALVIIVQLLIGHRHFWLPDWLLRRYVPEPKFQKALNTLHKPAVFIDRLINPRLYALTTGPSVYVIALICLVIAVFMPLLELVPFANTTSGAALALFGLALTAHDGVLVILGLCFCGVAFLLVLAMYSG